MPTTIHITDQGNQTISGTKTFDVFPIVSGNKLITGVDLSSYSTVSNLFATGSTLNNKINFLSGYVTGITGTFGTLPANLYSTGSTLDTKINSLSGYVTGANSTFTTNLANTGSTLQTNINNLSGYINSSASNIVFTTGNQIISGLKTFNGTITARTISGFQGSSSNSLNLIATNNNGSAPILLAGDINLTAGTGSVFSFPTYGAINLQGNININSNSSTIPRTINIYKTGTAIGFPAAFNALTIDENNISLNTISEPNKGFGLLISGVAVTPALYATSANLASTGSTLNSNINSLSGLFTGFTGALDTIFASDAQLYNTGSTLDSKINSLSGNLTSTYATITNLASTGSTLNTRINNLSGYVNSSSSNIVYTTGDQNISGNKSFYGDILLSGANNRIGQYHYIDVDNNFVKIRLQDGTPVFDSEELSLYDINGSTSIAFSNRRLDSIDGISIDWEGRSLANRNGISVLTWTGDNIGIGTNNPTEKLQVDGNIRINGNGGLYIYDQPNVWDNRITWQDSELLFELDFNNVNNSFKQAGFLFNSGPLGENVLYSYIGGPQATYLNMPSGRNGYIAVDSDLVATGSNLNNKINSLSGNLTATYSTISNLASTGSTLDTKINNLSGYLTGITGTFGTSVNSLNANAVFITGDQTISGNKIFNNTITTRTISGLSGVGGSNSISLKAIDNAFNIFSTNFAGGNIVLDAGSGNFAGGYINLNAGKAGNSAYNGTIDIKGNVNINNTTSQELNSRTINIFRTGLQFGNPAVINALTIDNNNISLNAPAGGAAGFGLLISGVLVTPALYVDTINNQTISGVKTFANSGVFSLSGAIPLGLPNNPLSVVGSGNTYLQINIQNRATGTTATADLVITANNGTDTTNYINLGINNSGYNDPTFSNGTGLDGYLFINGGNLDIGTQTSNTAIEFHAGGTTAANTIARITSSGLNVLRDLTVSGNASITGHLSAASKSFLIDHPTQIGKKLQYGSLEGPEHGVFVRGKTNDNIINLPNYWPALVDENSISVNLTPISAANNIYVVDYNNSRIITNGNNGNYYFYTIYGERKDIPKLTVEF